jgi:hypothetical protein
VRAARGEERDESGDLVRSSQPSEGVPAGEDLPGYLGELHVVATVDEEGADETGADRAEDRRDVDDGTSASGGDGRQLRAQAVEDGVLVDRDDTSPGVRRVLLHRRARAGGARIVDGDAQGPEFAGRGDGAVREFLCATALAPASPDVGGENNGAVGGKQPRDRVPDS